MSKVWAVMILAGSIAAMVLGQADTASQGLLESGQSAMRLFITLSGSMVLWSGLMQILVETGDMKRFGRALRRLLRPLFPGVEGDACWSAMGMNVAANILGLGNAATPAGIEAAQQLARQGECGLRALAMLLALNNSSLQLLPSTVMTMRAASGAANPADIWMATLISSGASTVVAVALMALANRGGVRRG